MEDNPSKPGKQIYPHHKDKQEYYANKVILSQSDLGFEVNHLQRNVSVSLSRVVMPTAAAAVLCLSVCHLKHNPIIAQPAHTLCSSAAAVRTDMLNLSWE